MKTLVILAILGCTFAAPSELVAPEPVEDTPEAAAAAEAGTVPEVINPVGAPESVVDTDEVAEAKAEFNAVLKAAGDSGVISVAEYKAVASLTYAASPFAYAHAALAPAVAPLTYAHIALAPAVAPLAYAHGAVAPFGFAHHPFGFAHAPLVL